MQRTGSLEKTLMLGKIEGRRRRGQQRMRWLDGITDSMDEFDQALGVGDGQGSLVCCSPWDCKESDTTEPLNRLTDYLKMYKYTILYCFQRCASSINTHLLSFKQTHVKYSPHTHISHIRFLKQH